MFVTQSVSTIVSMTSSGASFFLRCAVSSFFSLSLPFVPNPTKKARSSSWALNRLWWSTQVWYGEKKKG